MPCSKHTTLIVLLYLTEIVVCCMPVTTSELRIPFGHSDEKEHVRRAPIHEPGNIKITIKDQEQVRAKIFTQQIHQNQTDINRSVGKPEKEEIVITHKEDPKKDKEISEDNLAVHRAAFQKAKAFRARDNTKSSTTTPPSTTTTAPWATNTPSSSTVSTTVATTTTWESSSEEEEVTTTKPARARASKTLRAERNQKKKTKEADKYFGMPTNMCTNCPEMLLPVDGGLQKVCSNWHALEKNFKLAMDPKKPQMNNLETITTCSREVTCSSPHAIVKWPNFRICDVLNEKTSDLSFTFKCNGSQWSMNDFPIEAVSCVIKKN